MRRKTPVPEPKNVDAETVYVVSVMKNDIIKKHDI